MTSQFELYKKYRPTTLKRFAGNDAIKQQLANLLEQKKVPQFVMFTGDSGCGKTTLARILGEQLGSVKQDYREINAADDRGVDMVREVRGAMQSRAMYGSCRVFVIDEAHQITSTAQNAWLKMLEDPPPHAYIFFCTTDPKKLIKTIQTRATVIKVAPLKPTEMDKLIRYVCKKEKYKLNDEVKETIIEKSGGSARQALVYLGSVMSVEDVDDQLELLKSASEEQNAFAIAQLLFKKASPDVRWPKIAAVIKTLEDDPEGIRRMILAYGQTILLGQGVNGYSDRVHEIMSCFSEPYYNIGKPGLTLDCREAVLL